MSARQARAARKRNAQKHIRIYRVRALRRRLKDDGYAVGKIQFIGYSTGSIKR